VRDQATAPEQVVCMMLCSFGQVLSELAIGRGNGVTRIVAFTLVRDIGRPV
jgi:hypothetical protein